MISWKYKQVLHAKKYFIECREKFVLIITTLIKRKADIPNQIEQSGVPYWWGHWRVGNGKFAASFVVLQILVSSNVPILVTSQSSHMAISFI